jgi:hypothetical protein
MASPRTVSSDDGDVFWEEPDDDDDEGKERRSDSPFPSSSPFSRLEAAWQHEQELRRGIFGSN